MDVKEIKNDKEKMHLADRMTVIIDQLKEDKKHSAVHTYQSTLNSFRFFFGGEKTEVPLDEVFTAGTLKEYEVWLRRKGAKWNTVSTYMRTLRAVYNRIYPPGCVEHNPKLFDDVYTKVESQTKRALEKEQIQILFTADFTALPKEVQCALAYFLLMFLLRGMPFIDFAYLQAGDLKGNKLTYCRHKTGKQMTVRIPKEAERLFEEYRNKRTDSTFLFPIMDGSLKKDGELYAYYLRALRKFNKLLEKIAALLLPGVKLSSYTARHTWATLAFYQGIPIGIISKALGHSSIKVTETYLKPFENEKVDAANDNLIVSVVKSKVEKNAA